MALAGSLVLLVTFAFGPSSASAHRSPSLSWSISHTVDAGQPIAFSWTGSRLGRNHRLVVQRPVGTAHTWQTVMRLPTASGSGQLPGLSLGKYRLRLADLGWKHRLLAQQVRGISVFGQVPFSTLFNNHQNQTQTTPQYTFPYVLNNYGDDSPVFQVSNNNCRSVHVSFVAREYYSHSASGTEIFTLVQESKDPVTASTPYNTIGSLDAKLVVGQTWAVNSSHESQNQDSPTMAYVNGYAVCDSREAFKG